MCHTFRKPFYYPPGRMFCYNDSFSLKKDHMHLNKVFLSSVHTSFKRIFAHWVHLKKLLVHSENMYSNYKNHFDDNIKEKL